MGIVNFVFRRGAIYTWRRRIPVRVLCGGRHLQISLGTACPWTARRLAGIVTFESEQVFEAMAQDRLAPDLARKWLERVVFEELERINQRKRAQSDSRDRGYARANAAEDRAMGHALALLARDGVSADLGAEESAEIAAAGVPIDDLPKVDRYLQQSAGEVLSEAVEQKIRRGVAEVADLPSLNVSQYLESRQIYLRGRAVAYLTASRRRDPKFTEALDLAEKLTGRTASAPPSDLVVGEPVLEEEPAYDPAISAVADRLAKKKVARGKATDKTAYQITNTAALLVEATSVSDIRRLRQSDLARFSDIMAQLPPTYRKSSKEKDMSLQDIIAAASARGAEVGFSPATVNRNLGFIGQMLKHARSEGISIDPLISTSDLRETDDEDEQEKVLSFTRTDIAAIFTGAIWQGSASNSHRTTPGDLIVRDGHYWIPLIAAYSGARREEIAGLLCDEIIQEDGVWAFQIKTNELRRIKNKQSRRKIPIHEHLIEMGFLTHVQALAAGPVFPELKRPSKHAGLGAYIAHHWSNTMQKQLDQAAEGKNFHSFRHYVTDELRYEQRLPEVTRHHLLGHALAGEEDRRYGSRTPLSVLKPAIDALPRVF